MPTPIHKHTALCLQPHVFGATARITVAQWTALSQDASVSAGTCSAHTRTPLSLASTHGQAPSLEGQARGGSGTPGLCSI